MHTRVTPKRPNCRRRRRLSRTRTPRLLPLDQSDEKTKTHKSHSPVHDWSFTPPPPNQKETERRRTRSGGGCSAPRVGRAHVDGDGEKRDTEAQIEEHTRHHHGRGLRRIARARGRERVHDERQRQARRGARDRGRDESFGRCGADGAHAMSIPRSLHVLVGDEHNINL